MNDKALMNALGNALALGLTVMFVPSGGITVGHAHNPRRVVRFAVPADFIRFLSYEDSIRALLAALDSPCDHCSGTDVAEDPSPVSRFN